MALRAAAFALILVALASASATAGPASQLAAWRVSLPFDPRIIAEVERFEQDLRQGYASELVADLRRMLFDRAIAQMHRLESEECTEFVEVTFLDGGFALDGTTPQADAEREFEEGFICIEAVGCFPSGRMTASEALRAYTAPEFRQRVSSRIVRIFEEDSLNCVETSGEKAIVRPTLACNRIEELHVPSLSAQHSQLVSNGDEAEFQAAYFKESLKTFVDSPSGLALHYVNYTRANKFGSLKRLFGKKSIASSQEKAIDELRLLLQPATGSE